MKNVITYGTFDLFHIGHLRLLLRAKGDFDHLTVAVSTDEFNKAKGKNTIIPFEQRAEIVRNIRCVDQVIPEQSWEQKRSDIKKYKISRFAMGDDWKGKFDDLSDLCEVMYLERTGSISTTSLKESLRAITSVRREDINRAFEILEQLKQDLV